MSLTSAYRRAYHFSKISMPIFNKVTDVIACSVDKIWTILTRIFKKMFSRSIQ